MSNFNTLGISTKIFSFKMFSLVEKKTYAYISDQQFMNLRDKILNIIKDSANSYVNKISALSSLNYFQNDVLNKDMDLTNILLLLKVLLIILRVREYFLELLIYYLLIEQN